MNEDATPSEDQSAHTDNMAEKQHDEAGQAGVATPPGPSGSSTDAPVVPDDQHPQIPAGAVPEGGQPPSPQDVVREEGPQTAADANESPTEKVADEDKE